MKNIKRIFLTWFGDIKYFKQFFWYVFVYNPTTFKAKGNEFYEALSVIREGDVLLRGYDCYLDGLFIPCDYSHSGIYFGGDRNYVIHSIAEGVTKETLVDFLRCDRFAILRPICEENIKRSALAKAEYLIGNEYDFDFTSGNKAYYCHEFTAKCYEKLNLKKIQPTWLFGIIKRKVPVYLADSFLKPSKFKVVYSFNKD